MLGTDWLAGWLAELCFYAFWGGFLDRLGFCLPGSWLGEEGRRFQDKN